MKFIGTGVYKMQTMYIKSRGTCTKVGNEQAGISAQPTSQDQAGAGHEPIHVLTIPEFVSCMYVINIYIYVYIHAFYHVLYECIYIDIYMYKCVYTHHTIRKHCA